LFQVDESQIVVHEADDPDAFVERQAALALRARSQNLLLQSIGALGLAAEITDDERGTKRVQTKGVRYARAW
jgi:hypothetical protein